MCSFYLQICFFRGKNLISVLSHTICRSVFERKKNFISVLSHSICRSVFEREKNLISVLSHSICRSVFERKKNSHFCTFSYYLQFCFWERKKFLISVLSLILFAWHFFRIVFRSFCSSSFYLQLYIFMKFFPLHFLSVICLAIIFFYKVFPPFSYHFLLHSFKDRLPKDILWTQSLKNS